MLLGINQKYQITITMVVITINGLQRLLASSALWQNVQIRGTYAGYLKELLLQ